MKTTTNENKIIKSSYDNQVIDYCMNLLNVTEEEAFNILMEHTCYPFGDEAEVKKQLNPWTPEMTKKSIFVKKSISK